MPAQASGELSAANELRFNRLEKGAPDRFYDHPMGFRGETIYEPSDPHSNQHVSHGDPSVEASSTAALPPYLEEVYWWAYLRPFSLKVFDHTPVVSAILWGQYGSLKRAMLAELRPGSHALQAACVYGDLSPSIAQRLGEIGRLEVVDIAPLQVANCQRKLADYPGATVRMGDARAPSSRGYDAVVCFFLLHELPDAEKSAVMNGLLKCVALGGKAVFVDYHRPNRFHPAKPVARCVFRLLEPFARSLWNNEIKTFAPDSAGFEWRKRTFFGGLFQLVVAERVAEDARCASARGGH